MESQKYMQKPSKKEQKLAMESYNALAATIAQLKSDTPEIEIAETQERIKLPLSALKLLAKILQSTSHGNPVSIVPIAAEMTTQSAAEYLGCSRPHLVKLLEEGKIEYTKVGKHRRVKFEDVMKYKTRLKKQQKKHLIDIMRTDEETGLYDT